MGQVTEVTEAEFEAKVLQADGAVVVDFWAPWCGPCKAVAPELDRLSDKHDGVTFVKVNIDDAPGVAAKYNVMSIPTIGKFEGGEMKVSTLGAKTAEQLEKDLEIG